MSVEIIRMKGVEVDDPESICLLCAEKDEDLVYECTNVRKKDIPRLMETYNKVLNYIGKDKMIA